MHSPRNSSCWPLFQASRRFALLLPDLTGMKEIALHWIGEYGYAGIFSLLIFGIVGLPVPDELLLTFCGYLVYNHTLRPVPTFLAAFLGSSCGITFSYLLGRILDTYVVAKYGRVLHITYERIGHFH